ncbi:GTP-binding protein Rheb homolog [Atheta coriaria]|uniref:GTP-binding protein Rheb homolog n=1 Tax=Dalotia coriaria TaxID=877792 RepID=UPI0031F47535
MSCKQRKVVIMGYRSVGKSSLSIQFVEGQFVDDYNPTIENTFTKRARFNSQDYELKVIDTAGQDEYSLITSQYGIDIHGYVLVYSVTSNKSFEVIKSLYAKLLDITGKVDLPIVLVGNKTDLHKQRAISPEQGRKLAEEWKAVFLETSAKHQEDVLDIFNVLLREIERTNGNLTERTNCAVS